VSLSKISTRKAVASFALLLLSIGAGFSSVETLNSQTPFTAPRVGNHLRQNPALFAETSNLNPLWSVHAKKVPPMAAFAEGACSSEVLASFPNCFAENRTEPGGVAPRSGHSDRAPPALLALQN
jgi:hypothetical protein